MNMPELKAQALQAITRQLTATTAREELLSDFCRDHKEVRCLLAITAFAEIKAGPKCCAEMAG